MVETHHEIAKRLSGRRDDHPRLLVRMKRNPLGRHQLGRRRRRFGPDILPAECLSNSLAGIQQRAFGRLNDDIGRLGIE